jgi:hypothetical protein
MVPVTHYRRSTIDKNKRFKLNIMKAFEAEEERQLHKSIWGAMIEDEIPDPEQPATREVTGSAPAELAPAELPAAPMAALPSGQGAKETNSAPAEAAPNQVEAPEVAAEVPSEDPGDGQAD